MIPEKPKNIKPELKQKPEITSDIGGLENPPKLLCFDSSRMRRFVVVVDEFVVMVLNGSAILCSQKGGADAAGMPGKRRFSELFGEGFWVVRAVGTGSDFVVVVVVVDFFEQADSAPQRLCLARILQHLVSGAPIYN